LLSLEVEGAVGLESKDSKSSDLGFALPMVQAGPAALPMADAPYTECPSGVGK